MTKTETNGTVKLGLYLSMAAIILAMLGSVFYFAYQTHSNTDHNLIQDGLIAGNERQIREIQLRVNTIERDLNEIETQFCEADHLRNLTHANDLRWFAMLWQKIYSERLPTDNVYYPIVCNRKVKP